VTLGADVGEMSVANFLAIATRQFELIQIVGTPYEGKLSRTV